MKPFLYQINKLHFYMLMLQSTRPALPPQHRYVSMNWFGEEIKHADLFFFRSVKFRYSYLQNVTSNYGTTTGTH